MGNYKDLFQECEEHFGKVVRAMRDKDPQAIWFLFEYIEWRIAKEKKYATDKRDNKKTNEQSDCDKDEWQQLTFSERTGIEF